MKLVPVLEGRFGDDFDPSDAHEAPNYAQDPEIQNAVEEHFANVYRVFEDMDELPEEWIPALDKLDEILAKKGRGDSTQDYYIDKDMVPKLKRAINSGRIQQAFRWVIQNARTVEELVNSGELNDIIDELEYDRQDADNERRNPYGYRGVSRSDFMSR